MAKYPIKQSLRNIADIISKQVTQIDADLKTKSTAYNNLKGNLQNLEKKQTLVANDVHFCFHQVTAFLLLFKNKIWCFSALELLCILYSSSKDYVQLKFHEVHVCLWQNNFAYKMLCHSVESFKCLRTPIIPHYLEAHGMSVDSMTHFLLHHSCPVDFRSPILMKFWSCNQNVHCTRLF